MLCANAFAQDDTSKTSKKPLDLSTPVAPSGERGKYGGGERVQFNSSGSFGAVDLGNNSKLHVHGNRKTSDAVQDATGFDQTPGSTNFRSLAPAAKSGTPPYVGFTLSRPTTP